MSKKASPTAIGLFIIVGMALGLIGLVLFSSSRLFGRTIKCVVYFDNSLNGLNEGAPVKYRGVTIGSVYRVMIRFNQATNDTAMPVVIELEEKLVRERIVGDASVKLGKEFGEAMETGLRASLETESLLTGVLYISLEMLRYAPPPVFHQQEKIYLEIPSRPTEIQQLIKNLASMDIAGLANKLSALVTKIDSALGGVRAAEISHGLTNLLGSIDRLVSSPLITDSLTGIKLTLEDYRRLAQNMNGRLDPLSNGLTNSLAQLDQTLVEIRGSAQNLGSLLAPDSSLRHDLTLALEQLSGAATSLSALTDFLKDHPNAILTGRQASQGKKP